MSDSNDNTVRINTRISKELNDWLDKKSHSTGLAKSTLIYLAIDQYMKQDEGFKSLPDLTKMYDLMMMVSKKEDINND